MQRASKDRAQSLSDALQETLGTVTSIPANRVIVKTLEKIIDLAVAFLTKIALHPAQYELTFLAEVRARIFDPCVYSDIAGSALGGEKITAFVFPGLLKIRVETGKKARDSVRHILHPANPARFQRRLSQSLWSSQSA